MKLIVLGGAGFIGSNFCEFIRKNKPNWQILVLDKNITDEDMSRIDMFKFDITDRNDIKMLSNSFNKDDDMVLINFVSESLLTIDPNKYIDTNFKGVSNLLELCNYHNLRFIQISTNDILGGISIDSKKKLNINSPRRERTISDATKTSAEVLVKSHIRKYGLHANIIRCPSNYGFNMSNNSLIPNTIKNLLNDKQVSVSETENTIHSWIHVEDFINGIIKVLEKGIDGETYMFSGNNELSNKDLLKAICDKLGKDYSYIKYIPDDNNKDLKYTVKKHTPGISWTPKKKFDKEIGNICNWYKEQEDVK